MAGKATWLRANTGLIIALLVVAGWVWLSASVETNRVTTLRDNQVESCERVNQLRTEANATIIALQEFLHAAAEAREGSGDQDVADEYREIAASINPVPIPDCEAIIQPINFQSPDSQEGI